MPRPHSGDRPLAVVGNLNVDQWIQTVERFPRWDEEVTVDSARIELAGTAGYALLACHGLGLDGFVVSTIGDDIFGRFIQQRLASLDIDATGIDVVPGEETSLGMIFVGPDGRRGILSTLGAHRCMTVDVAERHDDRIAGCAEVFLCGNYLLPSFSPAAALPYARTLRARGQTVVFDPSWDPGGWSEQTRTETYELLPAVDVYLPNEEELLHLTGRSTWRESLAAVTGLAVETVVKRGAAGAVYTGPDGYAAVPAFSVNAVNTIGAGDVFDIGYLYGRRLGWPPERRLRFASALAAILISQLGPRVYPDAAAVIRFMAQAAPVASDDP